LRHIASAPANRTLALGVFAFGFEVLCWTAFTFMSKHLQDELAYQPGEVSLLFVAAGAFGLAGNVVAGTLGDRFGRRPVSIALLLLTGFSSHALYSSSGVIVPISWIGFIFALTGINVLLTALSSELFPTSARSTAAGFRMTAAALGGIVGLALESVLYDGSHADAILVLLPALGAAIIAVYFIPESAGRELEEIAPET
jgi:MFS family permease